MGKQRRAAANAPAVGPWAMESNAMDLLHSTDAGPNSALCLNLDSALAADSLPPLTFLADASLWFEATQERRPSGTECIPSSAQTHNWSANGNTETLDVLVTAACSGELPPPMAEHSTHVPQYTQLSAAAPAGMLGVGSAEADRLEVARIMEQLKKGWDGTTANVNHVGDPCGNAPPGISCRFESNTLFVDLCPLFTDDLRSTIQESFAKEHLPVQLRFPFGSVTVLVPLAQLWPPQSSETDTSPEETRPKISSVNEEMGEDGRKRWKCHLCENKVYATRTGLQSHFLSHTNQRPFACKICPKTFRQIGHLQSHLMLHRGQKNHQCKICEKRFVQKQQLVRHRQSCGKAETSTDTLPCSHEQNAGPSREKDPKSICVHCSKPVTKLARHIRTVHDGPNSSRPYICGECGSDFKLSHHWKAHMSVHAQQKHWQCDLCEREFSLEQHLKRHRAAVHGQEENEKFKCGYCDREFVRRDCLKDHQRVHTESTELDCDLCDRKFRRPNRLKEHKAVAHCGAKQSFPCPRCKMIFTRDSNLKRHLLTRCDKV